MKDALIDKAVALANQCRPPMASIPRRIVWLTAHEATGSDGLNSEHIRRRISALRDYGLDTLCVVMSAPFGAVVPRYPEPCGQSDGERYIFFCESGPGDQSEGETDQLVRRAEQFTDLLSVYRPEAVLVSSDGTEGLPAWIAARRQHLPLYLEVRERPACTSGKPAFAERDLFVIHNARAVFVSNPDLQAALARQGVAPSRLYRLFEAASDPSPGVAAAAWRDGVYALAEAMRALPTSVPDHNRLWDKVRRELLNEPRWYRIPVTPGQLLIIEAAIDYHNVQGIQDRRALLLFKGVDVFGDEVTPPCNGVTVSEVLGYHFRYLASTDGQVRELHRLVVPDRLRELHVGLSSFQLGKDEQIFAEHLQVYPGANRNDVIVQYAGEAVAIESFDGENPSDGRPRVMAIMDEFTEGCFAPELNLILPRPDNWLALAEKYKPAFVFIESAWSGNAGSWRHRVADYDHRSGHEVAHLCQYARRHRIPTLFWNKEDPVHHDRFMCSARWADHIFTTDADRHVSYIAQTGNPSVHTLPFAAQPALHKPAPLGGRRHRICFAGSWYEHHAWRRDAMSWLLDAAMPFGLDIYDRNHHIAEFTFPERYRPLIKGRLSYSRLCGEYARYRVFLNVNSVTDSPSMFSRRVFELMACGTPVVSTWSCGIENLLGSDAVWLVDGPKEAEEALRTLMTDDAEWRRRSLAGIRTVFSQHTYAHRLNQILVALGMPVRHSTTPDVLMLARVSTATQLQRLHVFGQTQSYRHFRVRVEYDGSWPDWLHTSITQVKPGSLTGKLSDEQPDALVGWLDPQSEYGEHYLTDLVNATQYATEADGWAKSVNQDCFAYGETTRLDAALWKADIFARHWQYADPASSIQSRSLYIADKEHYMPGATITARPTHRNNG